jgi:tetratricopeptide (TPR) repeat protein
VIEGPRRLLLLGVLAAACAPAHAQRGRQALARGEHGLAARELGRATEKAPDDATLWRDLALAHLRGGRTEPAVEAAQRAVSLAPEDPDGRLVRAQADLAAGLRDEALADARFVAARETGPASLFQAAILLLRLHRPDEALAAAERAAERSGGDGGAWANLAVLAVSAGRHEVAERAFDAGRKADPEHLGLAEAHASWLVSRRELAQARAAYQALLPRHENPGLVHLALALLSHELGDLARARLHSQAAVDALGRARPDVHFTHVVVLRDSGDLPAAARHLAAARRRFPGDESLARLAEDLDAR